MPEHNPGQLGGTMRLGRRRTVFVEDYDSITSMKLFDCCDIHLHLTCWRSMHFITVASYILLHSNLLFCEQNKAKYQQ